MMNPVAIVALGSSASALVYSIGKTLIDVIGCADFSALWRKIKDIFSAKQVEPMLNIDGINSLRNQLDEDLMSSTMAYTRNIPINKQNDFTEFAKFAMVDVIENCFLDADKNIREYSYFSENEAQAAVKKAKILLEERLSAKAVLEREDTRNFSVDTLKVINPDNPKGDMLERIVLRRKTNQIENLVLRGSQSDNPSTLAAFDALKKSGMLSDLTKVVGSGEASLAAIAVAFGLSDKELEGLFELESLSSRLRSVNNFSGQYPGFQLGTHAQDGALGSYLNFGFSGQKMVETLDHLIAENVSVYLQDKWEDIIKKEAYTLLAPAQKERLAMLKSAGLDSDNYANNNRQKLMIKFSDLAILHKLDSDKFKNLVLSGYDIKTKKTVYFSADSKNADGSYNGSFNLPICYAFRISQGSSLSYMPVETWVNGIKRFRGDGNHKMAEYITGKLLNDELKTAQAKTLVMTSEKNGTKYPMRNGTNGFIANAETRSNQQGFNILPIFNGQARGQSNWGYPKMDEKTQVELNTLGYIKNVMGSFCHEVLENPNDVVKILTKQEQYDFLQHYANSEIRIYSQICSAIREKGSPVNSRVQEEAVQEEAVQEEAVPQAKGSLSSLPHIAIDIHESMSPNGQVARSPASAGEAQNGNCDLMSVFAN